MARKHLLLPLALVPLSLILPITGSAAPAPAADSGVDIPYERYTLANGLEVILHPDASAPIVTANLWYHVGSGDETPGKSGFARLF